MYLVKKVTDVPALNSEWNGPGWNSANVLNIAIVRPESSDHHPTVECKLLHDGRTIYGMYRVQDRYVRAVAEKYNDSVCCDSCVEFFVEPAGGRGYLNFEFSGNGTLLLYHVRDHRRGEKGFADYNAVPEALVKGMEIFTTLPQKVEPEITEPTTWRLSFKLPLAVFEDEMKADFGNLSGQEWRANFYKCADKTSHPHWISWQPVTVKNFHLPECFAPIKFE